MSDFSDETSQSRQILSAVASSYKRREYVSASGVASVRRYDTRRISGVSESRLLEAPTYRRAE
ncbi:MAG: hypothetical protein O2856_18050, partial [Planctomycetota bacterium]|nr:hypothetical protein [Planctomycetota bacterium]